MKKLMTIATLVVATVTLLSSCKDEGFKTTENNVQYRFTKQNPKGQQVQEGDVLVGEMTIKFDTLVVRSTEGRTERLLRVLPEADFHLCEGLLMMHVGDVATFAIEADTLAKYLEPNQLPPFYQPGKGMKVYYDINLQDIVTKEEYEQENNAIIEQMRAREAEEPAAIAAYVADNKISTKPTADGLYVVVKKKGTGAKVAAGKTVFVNYTGRLLDGKVFDSSVEGDARTAGIFDANRKYEPISFMEGREMVIPGWEKGLMGQAEGTVLQLIIPSALAYGPRGAGRMIPPYSPLVFDIEIVSVK